MAAATGIEHQHWSKNGRARRRRWQSKDDSRHGSIATAGLDQATVVYGRLGCDVSPTLQLRRLGVFSGWLRLDNGRQPGVTRKAEMPQQPLIGQQ